VNATKPPAWRGAPLPSLWANASEAPHRAAIAIVVRDPNVLLVCRRTEADAPENLDVVENVDVTWAPPATLGQFIDPARIYGPVRALLEDTDGSSDA
jgi:hypothetical protein